MIMEPILDLPPDMPPHDTAPQQMVPCQTVAEWPPGTFLENLVVLPGGDVIVSVLSEARLDRVRPDGSRSVLHQFAAPTTGLALIDGALFVAVGEPGAGPPTLWRIDPASGAGEPWMSLPDMVFANGVTPFAPGALLLADSWLGRLVRVDLAARFATIWFSDERLTRSPQAMFLPGANGLKRYGHEVVVSSNSRALLLQIAVGPDHAAAGARLLAERLRVDDLAHDAAGALYLTTHIGHSLDRLDRDGTRVMLAGAAQGLAGSTACAFDAAGGLLVTTTGGIVAPPGGVMQPARLVRLDLGISGHSLDRPWEVQP